MKKDTLLEHFLRNGYDPIEFIHCIKNSENREENEFCQKKIQTMVEDWIPPKGTNMVKEIEIIENWVMEQRK